MKQKPLYWGLVWGVSYRSEGWATEGKGIEVLLSRALWIALTTNMAGALVVSRIPEAHTLTNASTVFLPSVLISCKFLPLAKLTWITSWQGVLGSVFSDLLLATWGEHRSTYFLACGVITLSHLVALLLSCVVFM